MTETLQTQQYPFSSIRFNQFQRIYVAGDKPKLKYAHLIYDEYSGGHDPIVVLTVEYSRYGLGLPQTPSEVLLWLVDNDGIKKGWTSSNRLKLCFTLVAKGDNVIRVWAVHDPCLACDGSGKRTETLNISTFGGAPPQHELFQYAGDVGVLDVQWNRKNRR